MLVSTARGQLQYAWIVQAFAFENEPDSVGWRSQATLSLASTIHHIHLVKSITKYKSYTFGTRLFSVRSKEGLVFDVQSGHRDSFGLVFVREEMLKI